MPDITIDRTTLLKPLSKVIDAGSVRVRRMDAQRPLEQIVADAVATRPRVAELPALTADGQLPAGIHDVDLGSFLTRLATNPYRTDLLRPFAERVLELQREGARQVIVGGSILSNKERPGDVDVLTRQADDARLSSLESAADWAHGIHWHEAEARHRTLDPHWQGKPTPSWFDYFRFGRNGDPRGVAVIHLSPGATPRDDERPATD